MAETKKKSPANKKASTQAAQEKLSTIEEKLSNQSKNMPQMSKEAKASVVKVLPWFSAAFGVLALVWAKDLWDGIRALDKAKDLLGTYATYVTDNIAGETELWVVLVTYVLIVVFVGLAFANGILQQAKKGWNFLFYAFSTAVISALLYFVLLDFGGSRAFLTLVLGLGGLYTLFQVRDEYK